MDEKYRLTTLDNPFNPFTEWDQWYFFDISQGYNTCDRIARIVGMVSEMPLPIYNNLYDEAAEQLLELGGINKSGQLVGYKKVKNPNLKEENSED